jgi:hypothetical protein
MMDHIRRLAWISVARGCGFGTLAIFTLMIGFISTPGIALDAGGFGFLFMAVVLMVKASRADQLPHNRTELWLMIAPEDRPPPAVAPGVITTTRREVMLQCAYISALTAFACLVGAGLVQLAGFR